MTEGEQVECPFCHRPVDDVWTVRRNGKLTRMCPGDVADRRTKGDQVEVTR